MRPLKLEFQGLHSYRDPVEIDFARLASGGFFGIFGPTGSGKSTILDAITLALFGKIDRTSSLADSISTGSDSLWVRFRFSLGDHVYEVYRKFERRGSGVVSSDFYLSRDGERLPVEGIRKLDRAIEELLGLSFEQFVTAVFLPQGKFARFLRLKPAERRMLLAEIFRLERFGEPLYRSVREACRRLEAEIEALRGELSQLEGVSEEALRELEGEYIALQERVSALREELEGLEGKRRAAEEFLGLHQETRELEGRFQELSGRPWYEGALEEIRERLELSARARELLSVLEEKRGLSEELSRKREELSRVEAELKSHRQKKTYLEEEGKRKLENLSRQETRLLELKGEISGIDPERVASLKGRLSRIEAELVELGEAEEPPFPPGELPRVEEAAGRARELLFKLSEAKRKQSEIRGRISEAKGKLRKLEEVLWEKERTLEGKEREIRGKRAELEELKRKFLAAELARGLSEGKPCPVCGSRDHPAPASFPKGVDLEGLEKEIEGLERAMEPLKREIASLESESRALERLLGDWEGELGRVEAEIGALEGELGELLGPLPEALRRMTWDEISGKIPRWRAHLRRMELEDELRGLKAELVRLAEIWGRVVEGLGEIYQPLEPEILLEFSRKVESRLKRISEEKRTVERNLEEFRRREAELLSRAAGLRGEIEQLEKAFTQTESKLEALVSSLGIPVEGAEALALPLSEKERMEEALEVGRSIKAARERLSSLGIADEDEAARVLDEYRGKRDEYEELQVTLGGVQERLQGLREKLGKRKELEARVAELERKLSLQRELEGLLRGKAFLEYLVGSQFEGILARASRYTAQLSQGRYILKGDGTELEVVDYRNGGVSRPPQTLSGGETFLVSLSLALALSEAIQLGRRGGAPPIEFFFIDEGFGSLDEESVRMVLELLYRLVDEGLKVGVITHVEALRRGIPYKLLVYPADEERGSRVELVIGE